jgi:hypothetical protein
MRGFFGWLSRRSRCDDSRVSRKSGRSFRPQIESLERRDLMARDAILDWNAMMLQANANDHALDHPEEGGPVLTARAFAITSAAMYDAYNSIKHIGNSYLTTVFANKAANPDAAVAQAAHDTLMSLFPSQKQMFDKSLKDSLKAIHDGRAENDGRAVGRVVAARILAARANDGTDQVMEPGYTPSGLPGFHAPDPLHPNQGFYASGGGNIGPFAMGDVTHFEAPHLDDNTAAGRAAFLKSDTYTQAYNEAMSLGGNGTTTPTQRTAEQTMIGTFWAYDGRPGLGTPPREYNQIVRVIATQQHNTESQNARLFALVNIAMADAGVAAWDTKYEDAFWRPIMGIEYGDSDGNPNTAGDINWQPLGAPASNPRPGETNFTPPFPAYTSGHATFGAAMFETLKNFYGRDDITFSFVSDEFNGKTKDASGHVRPVVKRTFHSFTEAKLENAESRIYLGIHWSFDRDEGVKQGDQVADYVFQHILSPNHPPMKASLAANSGK